MNRDEKRLEESVGVPSNPFYYVPTEWVLEWEFLEKRPEDFIGEYDVGKPKRSVGRPKGWKKEVKPLEIKLPEDWMPPLNP